MAELLCQPRSTWSHARFSPLHETVLLKGAAISRFPGNVHQTSTKHGSSLCTTADCCWEDFPFKGLASLRLCVLMGKTGRHRKATYAPTIHVPTTPIHPAVSPLHKHSLTLPEWLVLCVYMHVRVYCVHVCVRAHTCVGVFGNGLWMSVGPWERQ